MPVSDKEQQEINTLVARFETATGIQAVAAVVGKCDAYPEIPWKAYAIGSALGALTIVFPVPWLSTWSVTTTIAFHAMSILGAGAALAALASFVPAVGRLFLDRLRVHAEAQQYAQGVFLSREIFRTSDRRAVLVLVSRFERVAVILADKGLAEHAAAEELERIAATVRPLIARSGPVAAFEIAFDALAALFKARGLAASGRVNEIADAVVMEKGA